MANCVTLIDASLRQLRDHSLPAPTLPSADRLKQMSWTHRLLEFFHVTILRQCSIQLTFWFPQLSFHILQLLSDILEQRAEPYFKKTSS